MDIVFKPLHRLAWLDLRNGPGYTDCMSIGTRIYTWLNGREVGRDTFGNVYFEHKRAAAVGRRARWVDYAGQPDPSSVPSEWHSWLHYTTDAPLKSAARPWQKPHQPNKTGTKASYYPPAPVADAYEAWTPGS